MARQIGLLERARLEQEFDQAKAMAEKLRILHTLGMAIASAMDLEQVLTRIVEAAVFITEAEEGSLLLLDEETDEDRHERHQVDLTDHRLGPVHHQRVVEAQGPGRGHHDDFAQGIQAAEINQNDIDDIATMGGHETLLFIKGCHGPVQRQVARIEEHDGHRRTGGGGQEAGAAILAPGEALGALSFVDRLRLARAIKKIQPGASGGESPG